MWIYFSLAIGLLGVLLYALSDKPKPMEIGRLAYFAGLLAFLLQYVPHLIKLG